MMLPKSYQGVYNIFRRYWRAYGGWKEVLRSPYMHAATLLTVVLHGFWLRGLWWETAASVLPNIIGFALGGYALWLGFGDENFRRLLAVRKKGSPSSPYVAVSASFAHFILVQLLALLSAICAKGLNYDLKVDSWVSIALVKVTGSADFVKDCLAPIGHCVGFFLFIYSILTAIATSMAVFRLVTVFERDEEDEPA